MKIACSGRYSSRRIGGPHARRLLWALGASALIHAWLAIELPASGARSRAAAPVLTARLAPAVDETPVAVVAPEGESRAVVPGPRTNRGARSRDDVKRSTRSADSGRAEKETADAAPLAIHDDATYYPARELDVYPALLSPLVLDYPERALREDRRGRVLLMLLIDAAGRVDDIAVVEAEPPGYFEAAARKAFEQASFSGARRNGLPVRSRVLIHVDFDPRTAEQARR
jgi:protein TonB